jgi:hypothetical protein
MKHGEELSYKIELETHSEMKVFVGQLRKIKNPNKEIRELIDSLQYCLENAEYED